MYLSTVKASKEPRKAEEESAGRKREEVTILAAQIDRVDGRRRGQTEVVVVVDAGDAREKEEGGGG